MRILTDIKAHADVGVQDYHSGETERILKAIGSPARSQESSRERSHLRLVASSNN